MIANRVRLAAGLLVWLALAGFGAEAQDRLRFVMVTHGAASDPFWAAIKRGADRAAAESGVELVTRVPETFDLEAMASLVNAAAAEKPAGLIVSIPNADALASAIKGAVSAGVPVISIASGFDVAASLGALFHVGQSEYDAGRVAGSRMRELGGTKALCLNHELGNVSLDLRCKGFIDGFRGSVEVLPVASDPEAVREAVTERLELDAEIDAVLALSASTAGGPAVEAVRALGDARTVRIATFDTTEAILNAVADQDASFAIDQQPFLQGYLPVQYLVLLYREGVAPVGNVSTGPKLVGAEEAARRLGRPAGAGTAESAVNPVEPSATEPSGG